MFLDPKAAVIRELGLVWREEGTAYFHRNHFMFDIEQIL
jgi:hypothetical protein